MPLPRSIAKTLLYVIFLMVVTSAGLELALRVVMDGKLWLAPLENDFWRPDDQLGWDLVSNFSGEFDKGLFKGRVNVNTDGIRLNATEDTFVSAWPSVFLSATAPLLLWRLMMHSRCLPCWSKIFAPGVSATTSSIWGYVDMLPTNRC